ncbi:Bug family tripartite tricarboxylate transporter substrate binding protein [Plastoroseomonas hellenica]|uniref:Bug family tripartite tricarboxylate transporter substrate binding protein n=1 Tax=Plastoroseomonas hellenica TaxID=2687306 RepID=UPI001BA55A67|nr:tripartite tricarboxylate transporter substrate binding protein [Plastoroseomonas hellenica]MBR0646939.1 tripartite tricarboxylate transporter substrate binding protein [Plastoroseomonas hellenica]
MRLTRRTALGLLASLPATTRIRAQTRAWPSRSIRCIVPSAAGGYDTYARIMAPRLAELLGQPVVVDNRPGANGNIGMQEVQRSPADGHTILFGHIGAITINTAIYRAMPLDPVADLAAVAVAVTSPLVWVVNPATPFRTMPGLVAQVRAEPDRWRYALPSSGSINHLVVEDFKRRHGLDLPAVPYRGTPQAQMDVVAGQVPIMLDSLGAGYGHIAGNRFRPLAVTSREASARLPEVPTMLELGLDQREYVAWYAFMAPKATPPEVIRRLNEVVNQILEEAPIQARLRDLGAAPRASTPEESLAFMRAEQREFGAIARAGNIQVE